MILYYNTDTKAGERHMGADDKFRFIDMTDPRHRAVTDLLQFAGSANMAVHGTNLQAFTVVCNAGLDAVKALLADRDTTVPLLDECMRSGSRGCRGITFADEYDFPPYMHSKLDGAAMYRQYNVPDMHVSSLPLLAMAFLPSGVVLTVNEPHRADRINSYDGVCDTP